MKHLEPEQYHRLLRQLPKHRATNPFALLIELIARSGMRTAEILKFDAKRDINLSQGLLKVHGVKGSNSRLVPMPKDTLRAIMYIENFTQNPKTLKRRLRLEWAKLKQEILGFAAQGVSLHGLRASFAVSIYLKTKDIILCQELLGHKSLSSTAYYVKLVQTRERRSEILEALTGQSRAS